jgi:hypothetical protein
MYSDTKRLLNSWRCPVCQGPINLIDFLAKDAYSTSYNFGCATEYLHYRVWFPHWESPHNQIHYDVVHLRDNDKRYLYVIHQRYLISRSTLDVWACDEEYHMIEDTHAILYFQYLLFDYINSNIDVKKMIHRIQTILTFQ